MLKLFDGSRPLDELCKALKRHGGTVRLEGMVGGALSSYAAAAVERCGGIHVFVAEDRDAAAYLMNDFYALLDEERVKFFPSSYKRSIAYGTEDAQGVVQRTNTVNALLGASCGAYTVVCTYPEALAESIVSPEVLGGDTLSVAVGDRLRMADLEERLEDMGFSRVDFVYSPGQYSVRGGIADIFSYSESKPFRLDFFGDEIDSIRQFDISSQLSAVQLKRADIIPDMNCRSGERVSFGRFTEGAVYWFTDGDFALRGIDDVRRKALKDSDDPQQASALVTSRRMMLDDIGRNTVVLLRDNVAERAADCAVEFFTSPQPAFNRNFELLAENLSGYLQQGYRCCIVSENRVQTERLNNIFHQTGHGDVQVESLRLTLHEGFVDNDLKRCFYTDHQIFERYQRYRINGEIKRDEQMTVAELNALKVGDYVVHIDHGVGRFGGLVKIEENGKYHEAIKLVYRDNDVLFVNVHSLHRISRYKSGDGEPPKIYKLGGGAWQKLKTATKRAVKDISRELIALYAKRKASKGYAFSADTYLQQELEASFMWEDTPDQQAATEAVKRDMESSQPMDRLVCGDVGFGKTEIAIRAAFKAAVDGKQTAVLVPTTILALQHYRSFMERMRDFPVRVEYLNRTKSAKETRAILEDLASGKIDIIIGTHKILGKNVHFHDLGLLIIDEEQKFGVTAKEKLTQMSVSVDTLTMTATPIPRTLQFSIMGSRDLSVISTPPPNRRPIVTESHIFSEGILRDAIEAELSRNGQVFIIHNKVDELERLKRLVGSLVPSAEVRTAHGRMAAEEIEKTLMDFIYGDFDILIATTLVENGIDIPNVNTIIINQAQNFGLSELHQLRGRVGRSDRKAYCYLLTPPDELLTEDARRRLRAIEEFSDLGSGFNIAMQDLDIRGAGNLLGAEQSGFIADIGFETYQKIMQEAISELRSEGLDVSGLSSPEREVVESSGEYISDSVIDVDIAAELPESYVRQQAERLRLYRELDSLRDDAALDAFASRLRDRFGDLPPAAVELLNVVRLRREAVRLGMERVKVKNGLMIVRFIGDQSSPYFASDTFRQLLLAVTQHPDRFVLKQRDDHLAMTVRRVGSVAEACNVLRAL